MRVAGEALRRRGDADEVEQFGGSAAAALLVEAGMGEQALLDLAGSVAPCRRCRDWPGASMAPLSSWRQRC
jgi:hypothetical protein